MQELLEKVIVYLPRFITEFSALLSGPKRFLAARRADQTQALDHALIFGGVSFTLCFILSSLMLVSSADFWTSFISNVCAKLIEVVLYALAVRLAWWLVGGRASFVDFLIIYSYAAGVLLLVRGFGDMLLVGVIRFFDPRLYQVMLANAKHATDFNVETFRTGTIPDLTDQLSPVSVMSGGLIVMLITVFGIVWFISVWGAYRQINLLSKGRSLLAATLYIACFNLLIAPVMLFVQKAVGLI